jgi:hypothetical protein
MIEYFQIELTQGKVARVSREDWHELSRHTWRVVTRDKVHFYAARHPKMVGGKRGNQILMHRYILNCPDSPTGDHINCDTLDNRRENLRPASFSENARNSRRGINNTSGLKGVCWNAQRGKWQAGIKTNGRSIHLGLYTDKYEAHAAYYEAASRLFGEFARAA